MADDKPDVSPQPKNELKPSRKSFALNYAFAVILVILLIILSAGLDFNQATSRIIFLFVLIFISMLVSEPEKEIQENTYSITDNEVIHSLGIFSKKQTIIPYNKIESIKVDQSVLGRILKFGNISVNSAKDQITMRGLKNVNDVYKLVSSKVNLSSK